MIELDKNPHVKMIKKFRIIMLIAFLKTYFFFLCFCSSKVIYIYPTLIKNRKEKCDLK